MRCRILLEAAKGLAYLHSEEGGLTPVVHLDVKRYSILIQCIQCRMLTNAIILYCIITSHSSNILLDGALRAKIGDFGFAMEMPKPTGGKSFVRTSSVCGTRGYVAPEFHQGEMGPKADVFSFGVVNPNSCWQTVYFRFIVLCSFRLPWRCTLRDRRMTPLEISLCW